MALRVQTTSPGFTAGNVLIPGLPGVGTTVLWQYLGGSLALSPNIIPGAPAPTAVGAPVYQAGYASVTQANYLNDNLADDSKTFTLLFAARMAVGSGNCRPLALNDTASNGFMIQWNTAAGVVAQVFGNGATATLPPVVSPTSFKLFAVAYNDTTTRNDIYNLTDGTTAGITGNVVSRTSATTGRLLLGSNTTNVGNQTTDVAFAGKVNGAAWTLPQCQQALLNIRAQLASRGITV